MTDRFIMCGHSLPRGYYTQSRPYKFVLAAPQYFGGRAVPAGIDLKFHETRNFGFITGKRKDGTALAIRD